MSTSGPIITTYAEYLSPGSFVANETVRESPDRDPLRAAREAPEGAYGFRFFERVSVTTEIAGEMVSAVSDRRAVTGIWYIDAEILDAAQVAALPGDHKILLSNMRANRWDRVVSSPAGWFQPFREDDRIISSRSSAR